MAQIPDADVRPEARNPVRDADVRPQAGQSPVMDYMDYIGTPGFQRGPVLTSGAIGTSFLTWGQSDFRRMRRRYGEGDPSVGSYNLNQVHFNKENGTLSVQSLDVGPSSWYGSPSNSYDPTQEANEA